MSGVSTDMCMHDARRAEVLDQAMVIVPDRFVFLCGNPGTFQELQALAGPDQIVYCIDDDLEYEPFYSDFGPLNMGHTYTFCMMTLSHLRTAAQQNKMVCLYAAPHACRRANAAALVGIFQTLFLGRSPEQAHATVAAGGPYTPFRDASTGESVLPLSVLHIIQGMKAAEQAGFLPWTLNHAAFDLKSYQHYEQVQNGDLNWVVPGKLLAFAGPTAVAKVMWGFRSFTPQDYWPIFDNNNITDVVRLNNKLYEPSSFIDGGFQHHDLYFPDGSCPTNEIVLRFLKIAENARGGVAIHCKAGLGRTGVLICCYMMKHFGFTAEEAISYIRVCRPGSVIGPQQTFLKINECELWRHGEAFRSTQKVKATETANSSPSGKRRLVIDITASSATSNIRLPERPGPYPGAMASPLQDAKSARRWPTAVLEQQIRAGPLGAGAAANASAENTATDVSGMLSSSAATVPLPPLGPVTRSGGPRVLETLRNMMGGYGSSGKSSRSSSGGGGSRRSSASDGSEGGEERVDTPPASPVKTGAAIPSAAKASPHFLAANGQPRKGAKVITNDPKARRGLDFGATATVSTAYAKSATIPADDWSIAVSRHTSTSAL